MIHIHHLDQEPFTIESTTEQITGFELKYRWLDQSFTGWIGKDIFINQTINDYWIADLSGKPIQDYELIQHGDYNIHYRQRGGKKHESATKYPTILAYFIVLTGLFLFLLYTGYMPFFCKIYSYIMNYIVHVFVNLPYVRMILEPFTQVGKSNMPLMMKIPIYIVQFLFRSLITIVQFMIMFLFLYGFFTIGLFIALYWIHKQPIQTAVKRAKSVANILTLLYLMFYTIVLFPQFVKGFLLWAGDAMENNPIGIVLKSVSNLFNFTLIPFFTWISSIGTSQMANRIWDIESKTKWATWNELIPILIKVDLNPSQNDKPILTAANLQNPLFYETFIAKARRLDRIPIQSVIDMLAGAIIEKRITIPQHIGNSTVLAFMANYLQPDQLTRLQNVMGVAGPPGKAMKYMAMIVIKLMKMVLQMIAVYENIVPGDLAYQMKTGGTVAGYMTGIGFIIAFIILAITG